MTCFFFCLLIGGQQLLQGLEKGEVRKKTKVEKQRQSATYVTNGFTRPIAAIHI
jgi:hypothetical protein